MRKSIERIFYYHAAASPLGGQITHPVVATLDHKASTCIPQAGGHASASVAQYNLNNLVRCESAYSHTVGSVQKSNGNWTTLVTSVVEGVNLFDIVTVDRMVATIATEHHREGYYPKASFVGSQFENLRVAGKTITPLIDVNILSGARPAYLDQPAPAPTADAAPDSQTPASAPPADTSSTAPPQPSVIEFPDTPWPDVQSFVTRATDQSDRILRSDAPDAVKQRFAWVSNPAERAKRGYVLCSLVDLVPDAAPGTAFGHVIDVPDLGRLYLGELIVDQLGFHLAMMRVELGCLADGDVSMSCASGHGLPMP